MPREDYAEFVEKFKPKSTTDDCYTPEPVYEEVVRWCESEYGVERSSIVRPFFPGGDYERERYPDGCCVVDNPPFSILSRIVRFYCSKSVPFFLFAPTLTLFTASEQPVTYLACGCTVTYANGAKVNTSFITNMEPSEVRAKSAPGLRAMVQSAADAAAKAGKRQVRKLDLPVEVVTAARLAYLAKHGVELSVTRGESVRVSRLDNDAGSGIFGGGFLTSERAAAERAAAERAAAERIALSPREAEIVRALGAS